nr:hypothetical protein [Tanacetum cinerariifolium]
MRCKFNVVWAYAKSLRWLSISASLRMKSHLSLNNDMPLRDKTVTVVRGSPAEVDGGCGVGTKVVATRGGEWCGGSSRSGEGRKVFRRRRTAAGGGQLVAPVGREERESCFDDLDFFKDFENEFPAIVYNNAPTSKSDLLTEPTLSTYHIDEFDLKDETSLSKCDEEEQNVLNFNDLFHFNIIYPNDSKSDKDNDDDKVDIEHSSGDMLVIPLSNVINVDVGTYAHGSNKLLETSHDTSNKIFNTEISIKELNFNIMTWNHLNKGMPLIFLIKNLYVPFGIPFDRKLFYKDGIKLGKSNLKNFLYTKVLSGRQPEMYF